MKNADEAELRLLASPPRDITVHNVLDFPQLGALAGLLSRLVCQRLQDGGPRRGLGAGQGHPHRLQPHLAALGRGWGDAVAPRWYLRPVPVALRGSAAPAYICPQRGWGAALPSLLRVATDRKSVV